MNDDSNVPFFLPVSFHPELPIILTGSEDCTVRVWHVNTYRLESTLNYGLDRVWCISSLKGSNNVCFGYDEGSVMIKVSLCIRFFSLNGEIQ